MATYHLSVKFGGKGQAANHADYIERKEKYRDRQDLEYSAHGNMPEWARDNPSHFWQAADQFERANGSTYRELEIALPRELTPEQRLELVQDFVRQEAGEQTARQRQIIDLIDNEAGLTEQERKLLHVLATAEKNDLQAQESERKQAVQKRIEGKKQRRERNHRLFLAAGLLIEAGLVDTKTGELCYKKDRILQALKELKYDLETSPNPDA
ncbi:MobA/MobL family protein [Escherichia coli]|nr:MobA/MobL family protein [Escherichia coli]